MASSASFADSNTNTEDKIRPAKLAHIVLRAKRFDKMLDWYKTVFHATATFESPAIAFLSYDEEHHRIALLNTGHMPEPDPDNLTTGVDHVAFTYNSLSELLYTWDRLRTEHGIEPFWCINHGPTTSMYFHDPDRNEIELQVDNFPTMEECRGWFESKEFEENPIGADFDPTVLMQKMNEGVPERELKKLHAAPVPPEKAYNFTKIPPPPSE